MQAIKKDFMQSNMTLLNKSKERRHDIKKTMDEPGGSYFPFVSGDLVENHRRALGVEMKSDL